MKTHRVVMLHVVLNEPGVFLRQRGARPDAQRLASTAWASDPSRQPPYFTGLNLPCNSARLISGPNSCSIVKPKSIAGAMVARFNA